ncbi:MAG: biopolymer transporter ExbD, partial [Verrucomicrobiales bacterium]|nr:biopolymer transporter ExbD [Verrucomicrobiales bacterium]
ADGAVEWDGDRLPAERLAERAQQEIERRPDLGIILHVDASTPVQSLLPILRDLARAGVRHTAFQTAGPAHPTASPAP